MWGFIFEISRCAELDRRNSRREGMKVETWAKLSTPKLKPASILQASPPGPRQRYGDLKQWLWLPPVCLKKIVANHRGGSGNLSCLTVPCSNGLSMGSEWLFGSSKAMQRDPWCDNHVSVMLTASWCYPANERTGKPSFLHWDISLWKPRPSGPGDAGCPLLFSAVYSMVPPQPEPPLSKVAIKYKLGYGGHTFPSQIVLNFLWMYWDSCLHGKKQSWVLYPQKPRDSSRVEQWDLHLWRDGPSFYLSGHSIQWQRYCKTFLERISNKRGTQLFPEVLGGHNSTQRGDVLGYLCCHIASSWNWFWVCNWLGPFTLRDHANICANNCSLAPITAESSSSRPIFWARVAVFVPTWQMEHGAYQMRTLIKWTSVKFW